MGFGSVNNEYSDESITLAHSSYHIAKEIDLEDTPVSSTNYDIAGSISQASDEHYFVHTATGTNYPFFHIDIPDFFKGNL